MERQFTKVLLDLETRIKANKQAKQNILGLINVGLTLGHHTGIN